MSHLPGNLEITKCSIEPVGHRVLILPDPVEEVSKGGIVVATAASLNMEKRGTRSGVVVEIGPQAFKGYCKEVLPDGTTKWGDPWVNVGDRVSYVKYAGDWITDEHTKIEYLVVNDEDIKARIRPVPKEEE